MSHRISTFISNKKARNLFFGRSKHKVYMPCIGDTGYQLRFLGVCFLLFVGTMILVGIKIVHNGGVMDEATVGRLIQVCMFLLPLMTLVILAIPDMHLGMSWHGRHFIWQKEEKCIAALLNHVPVPAWHSGYLLAKYMSFGIETKFEGMRIFKKKKQWIIAKNVRGQKIKLRRFYYEMDPHNSLQAISDQVYELSEIDLQWDFRPIESGRGSLELGGALN